MSEIERNMSEFLSQKQQIEIYKNTCRDKKKKIGILTYITILTRPARETLAEISTNQIVAWLGIHTWLVLTFIGIFENNCCD